VFKVMAVLASRRGIVLVALASAAAVLNALGVAPDGFADGGW
jgi:hypothetical protein